MFDDFYGTNGTLVDWLIALSRIINKLLMLTNKRVLFALSWLTP